MIQSLHNFKSRALLSPDGVVGSVTDAFFDDQEWTLRYLVVKTGEWLGDRKILISPEALQPVQEGADTLSVNLSREQIEKSPDINTEHPLSRQDEEMLRGHYGWPLYWGGISPLMTTGLPDYPAVPVTGEGGGPLATDNLPRFEESSEPQQRDPHLRSFNEVQGYSVNANDGKVGTINDLLVDDASGRVMYMVVDTGNLFSGRKVLLSPSWVQQISWMDEEVDVDLKTETIKASPEYDPALPFDEEDEDNLYRHYGKTRQ
jgi:sporulation protein YlmC with PRC-barrel domain